MLLHVTAPVVQIKLRGAGGIPHVVGAIMGRRGLAGVARPPEPKEIELLGYAMDAVLSTVIATRGEQNTARATVELWAEQDLAVIIIRFSGEPLPDWLLANWDRARPPVPMPRTDYGWAWRVVREAIDSVSQVLGGESQLLFLEKRL